MLIVVAYHTGMREFAGGFVGVDVFFVLSGYLITGLLMREAAGTGRIDIRRFYARRARRLLPASALMLLTVVCAALILYSPLDQVGFSRTAISTAAYASNFFFLSQSTNYFAPDINSNPLLHTWSLGVEEQFYLVWPIVVLLASRRGRSRRMLIGVMAAITILSFAAFSFLVRSHRPWAFFPPYSRAWEFGIGALIALAPPHGLRSPRLKARAIGFVGLLVVILTPFLSSSDRILFPVVTLLAVAGTAGILSAGAGSGVGRILAREPLPGIGRLSYSWYLWNWPLLVMVEKWANKPPATQAFPLYGRVLCAFASLGLAALTHHLVENPIRYSPWLSLRPALSLGFAFAVTAGGIGGALLWQNLAERNPQYVRYARAVNDKSRIYDLGCRALGSRPRECVFGDPASATTLVLFGDSHAAQWFPALEDIADRQRWRLLTLIKADCPAASSGFSPRQQAVTSDCAGWGKAAMQRILILHPALVIAGNAGQIDVRRPGHLRARFSYDDWREACHRTLAGLDSAGVRTILLRDSPMPNFDVPRCLANVAWRGSGTCSVARSTALDEGVFRADREAAAGLSRVTIVDMSDQICGPAVCEPMDNGLVVYRDSHHLTASFAATRARALESALKP